MSEPLLQKERNDAYNCCANLVWNTTIPLILTLAGVSGLWSGFNVSNKLSYDEYIPSSLATVNPTYNGGDGGIPTATLSLCIWTFGLLLFNLYEWCIVYGSKYYISPSTNKSYVFTSSVLLFYILALWFHYDLFATIIPGIFLFKFIGVESFYDISRLFTTWDHVFCCNKLCCNIHRCFRIITYSCLIVVPFVLIIFTIDFYDIRGYRNESQAIVPYDLYVVAVILFFICMASVLIFNIVLLLSLGYYTSSLYLLKVEYAPEILDQHVLKLIQKKMWRIVIYLVFVMFITAAFINRVVQEKFSVGNEDIDVYLNNISVLSLVTLILYYEQPSFHFRHPYLECHQCKTQYLKSMHCTICGETDNAESSFSLSPVALEISSKNMNNCDGGNNCQVFIKLATLSSKRNFVDATTHEFLAEVNNMYDDLTDLEKDFNHIIDKHAHQNFDNCKCGAPRRLIRIKSIIDTNDRWIMQFVQDIHRYIHHNFATGRIRQTANVFSSVEDDQKYAGEEEKKNDSTINNQDDAIENDTQDNSFSYKYDFGPFVYYKLLRAKYASFKAEMVESNKVSITSWNDVYKAAQQKERLIRKFKSEKRQKFIKKYNHNNILKVQQIQIADILAIKFYTDFDQLQEDFRKSFRKISAHDTNTEIIKGHIDEYYFFGKWIHHAVTVYGEKIDNNNVTYYHGLSRELIFDSVRKDFNIPTSVTTDMGVAQRFAKIRGIILQLQCQWAADSEWNRSKSLPVDWISQFPGEKEVLLFGNFNQLMISNIFVMSNFELKQSEEIAAMNNFEKLCNGLEEDGKCDNAMKILFEKEVNGQRDNYYQNLFHNICEKREYFVIQKFIEKDVQSVFEVLANDDDIYCWDEECKQPMIGYDYNGCVNYLHCVVCRKGASWYCKEHIYALCEECAYMIRKLKILLPNAKHILEINVYDETKMKALRIESLQERKLL